MFDFDILIGDFRNIISAIGRTSIQKDCLVPRSVCDRHPEEVDTMQRHGMVCKLGNGKMQLSSLATSSVTVLSKPVNVREHVPNESLTAFEGRATLQSCGWTVTDYGLNCSVLNFRMMKYQCKEYYYLLLCQRDNVLKLTEENCFSHVQRHGYYNVILHLCEQNPFEAWH